ncbi:MATE family efflux transporter [Agaribacter flavus]
MLAPQTQLRHKRLLSIAFPLIVANITTPLLGLVDTAILGRMGGLHYLAGAAVGSLIITQLYWVCGFLKMSITGLSAQADPTRAQSKVNVVVQGVLASILLAIVILLLNPLILKAGLWFVGEQGLTNQSTVDYFETRIWGAPAALTNLVLIGWLVGQQLTRSVLIIQVFTNIINIIASLVFVYFFDWGVTGVAAGTLVAEYASVVMCFSLVVKALSGQAYDLNLPNLASLLRLASLNANIFIRNLALQFTLAFVTLIGVGYGTEAAAMNAILMQFFSLIALGLDGIANAVESLVGRAKGQKDFVSLKKEVNTGLIWSSIIALLYTTVFYVFGDEILRLLSNNEDLFILFEDYHVLVLLLPLVSHWCFLFDGVYVGLTAGKTMRNTMLISTLCVFLPTYYLNNSSGNMALWLALLAFLASRGVLLWGDYYLNTRRYPHTRLFGQP